MPLRMLLEMVAPKPPWQAPVRDEGPKVVVGLVAARLAAQQRQAFLIDRVVQPSHMCEGHHALPAQLSGFRAERAGNARQDDFGVGVVQGQADDGRTDVRFAATEGGVDLLRPIYPDQPGSTIPADGPAVSL